MIEKMKKLYHVISIIILLCLISCTTESKTIVITPLGNEIKYAITEFQVTAGHEVTIVMNNTATEKNMKHNIVILKQNANIKEIGMAALKAENYIPESTDIIAYTKITEIGTQNEVTFLAPKEPGKYPYICTYPGHFGLMQGIMTVK